ncbi:hypothetical protein ACJZ2D_007137 [Fusarium nematophilum]
MGSTEQSITAENVPAGITPSDADCNTCSQILQIFKIPFLKDHRVELGRVADILAHDCPHAGWLRNIKFMYGTVPRYETRSLCLRKYAGYREAYFGLTYITKSAHFWSTSRHFELVFRPEVPKHQGRARILDSRWVDMDLVKDWCSRCIQDHADKCDVSVGGLAPFKPQRLVDVVQGCVVLCIEENPRFITLSYTWGQTNNFRTTKSNFRQVRKPGALLPGPIASQIPKTIRDAIELTKALGETWLWVDSLCIIQDDQVSLGHELKHMHRIYATSFLTIIAADGQDAEHGLLGLEGISSPRTTNQLVLPLAGDERIAFMRSDYSRREPSIFDYDERMWTFQEKVFAKRRLTFGSGYVTWRCNCAGWSENQMYYPEADGRWLSLGPSYRYAERGIQSHIPSLNDLTDLVRDFNQKALGFDEDVFSAFSGLYTRLNGIFPSGLVFGHPELFFDISLCWYSVHNLRRRKASKGYTGDPVRDGLPSWSWMGWQGATLFPFDLECQQVSADEAGFTEVITQWYAIESPGSVMKRPIHSTWDRHRKAGPEKMPDGWKCTEFKPPAEWHRNFHMAEFQPQSMPKELPSHTYSHISERSESTCPRWYPVPMPISLVSDNSSISIGSPDMIGYSLYRFHLIKDDNGRTVGGLRLQHKDDSKLLQEETLVELVAVAKGWSSILKRYVEWEEDWDARSEDDELTEEEEEEEGRKEYDDHFSREDEIVPWLEQWELEKEKKQDCYHVLWIERENGVAYRKASGFVLADDWERLAESAKVELTLG